MNGEKQKENNTSDFFAKLLLFLLFKLYSVTIVVIPGGVYSRIKMSFCPFSD